MYKPPWDISPSVYKPSKTPYKDVSAAVYDKQTPKGKIDESMKDNKYVVKG